MDKLCINTINDLADIMIDMQSEDINISVSITFGSAINISFILFDICSIFSDVISNGKDI